MALIFRHNPYLLTIIFIGFFITGCSKSGIKETSPIDKQQVPAACPLKEQKSTIPLPDLHPTEKPTSVGTLTLVTEPLPLFPKSFAFRYDIVVDRLLNTTASISFYPQDDLAKPIDHLNRDLLANYRLQSEKKVERPIIKLLDRSENFKQIETILSKARHFVGVPYRRGGTSPQGFDCSGLVYYTLKHTGISVPRSAHDQYLHSTPIKKSELRPGDLVFFRINRRSSRITHVGIYLGDNRFIHARSGGRKVDITSLSDNYYSARFVRGGRVL